MAHDCWLRIDHNDIYFSYCEMLVSLSIVLFIQCDIGLKPHRLGGILKYTVILWIEPRFYTIYDTEPAGYVFLNNIFGIN